MFRRATLAALLAASVAAPGFAQAPAPVDQGRPPGAPDLRPHPPRLTATPVERIPAERLRVPAGFQVELWASGMPGIRAMTRAPDGTIFAGTRAIGRVYAIRDLGDRREGRVFVQGLTQPSGVTMRGGDLYVAAINRILRFDNAAANLDSPQPVELTAAFNLPPDVHHGWKHIAFGPDGRLYVPVGVPCNICDTDHERFALIRSFNPDGTDGRIEARGVRNSVGFDFHPRTGQLWFTNHGRDWAMNDNPADTLHVLERRGEHFGFPWCAGGWQDTAVQGRLCSEFPAPTALLGPHVAPIGTHFYTGTMFPEGYRERLFVALRGSWNRVRLSGFEVVTVRFEGGRPIIEPFLTGLRDDESQRFFGRPTGLLTLPDGSMLISDEENGAIYRVTHRR